MAGNKRGRKKTSNLKVKSFKFKPETIAKLTKLKVLGNVSESAIIENLINKDHATLSDRIITNETEVDQLLEV